jgi:hypothetical protein
MENRFGAACALFSYAPPASVAHACRPVTDAAIPCEIHIRIVLVRWPMTLEIIQEARPIFR